MPIRCSDRWRALAACAVAAACASPPTHVDTTVRISSSPPGALVLFVPSEPFAARDAVALGTTPLLRNLQLPSEGSAGVVQVWQRDFKPAEARLSRGTSTHTFSLQPSEPPLAPRSVPRCVFLRLAALDTRRIDDEDAEDERRAAERLRPVVWAALSRAVAQRFAERARLHTLQEPPEALERWDEIADQLHGVPPIALAYAERAPVLELPPELTRDPAAAECDALLLARVTGSYLSERGRLTRSVAPVALTLLGAVAGIATAEMLHSPIALIPIWGPPVQAEGLLLQLLLVERESGALDWALQRFAPGSPEEPALALDLAEKAIASMPAAR